MAYQRDDIERVRQATNLVELIEAVTTVRKQGRTYKAICPFHQEKTPSLSIDPARGLFHCFGCNAGGDVFRFVQETQGLDFSEAVELLAARAGITLQRDPQAARRRGEREELIEAVRAAMAFYQGRLKQGGDAGPARAYLRGRGYDAAVVDDFHLGFAPEVDGWDALVRHLRDAGVKDKVMMDAGLAVRSRGGRLRDWFHGRVLFPIFDLRGDPVGFGARLLQGEGPKYLNSPETRIYQKARLLYGLNWAKADITRTGHSLVVEGYTDVIALHRAGFPQAVATCGTALGEDHFDLLRRFADRVILAFDADQAGAGAALRGDELRLPADLGLDLRVAEMPEGRDPADLVQDGDVVVLEKAVADSQPLLLFRIERELERFDLDEPEGRARAVRATAALVARQPDALARDEYARVIARRAGTELAAVQRAIAEAGPRRAGRRADPGAGSRPSGQELAERELIRVMLANPAELKQLELSPDLFTIEEFRAAFELLRPAVERLPPGEVPDLAAIVEKSDDATRTRLRQLALDERPLADPAELWRRLEVRSLERQIDELKRRLQRLAPEADDYSQLFEELIALERSKRSVGTEP